MHIWAANPETEECWSCNETMIVAQVANALRISTNEAEDLISKTSIESPLEFTDNTNTLLEVWVET